MPDARVLCVFGTASDVGKSWITAGLCRLFAKAGVDVAPYKAQNMSNNAGLTATGLEMGRAQIVQAHACGLAPEVDMNPLLLKPNTDIVAQVVALGRVVGQVRAREYFSGGMEARRRLVLDALDRLRRSHALIIAEGAGSCAEVNLRERDLVNFPVAHHAQGPVILVADINKGGVFAQIMGTLSCALPEDRARVKALIVNRFRGDPSLFDDGVAWLQAHTGVPVLGVVPWRADIQIEPEDGLPGDVIVDPPPPDRVADPACFYAAVLRLPHIANFTDFDALYRHGVKLHYLSRPRDLSPYDLLILPGTKNTRGDLNWLRGRGWEAPIHAYEGHILGLCGGFQMLGNSIVDPLGVEGPPGNSAGLGLLPLHTVLDAEKTTRRVHGTLRGVAVEGYEIHAGRTSTCGPPLLHVGDSQRPEGLCIGRVAGTYVHGLFDAPGAVAALLGPIRPDLDWPPIESHAQWRERQLDALATQLRESLDLGLLGELAGVPLRPRVPGTQGA